VPTVEGAPLIASYDDDLITKEQLAAKFNVSLATVDAWRYGARTSMPRIPYLRLGNAIYFSKTQVTWWLNQYQQQIDPYHADRMRRLREGIKVGKNKRQSIRKDAD
jgi:hypothetical protein